MRATPQVIDLIESAWSYRKHYVTIRGRTTFLSPTRRIAGSQAHGPTGGAGAHGALALALDTRFPHTAYKSVPRATLIRSTNGH